jgi:hypothetical protein
MAGGYSTPKQIRKGPVSGPFFLVGIRIGSPKLRSRAVQVRKNAGYPEIELERTKLTARLVSAIDRCIQEPEPTAEQLSAMPSTFNEAVYFESGKVLAQAGGSAGSGASYSYSTETFCYLRLMTMPTLERLGPGYLIGRRAQGTPVESAAWRSIEWHQRLRSNRLRGRVTTRAQSRQTGCGEP